MTDVRWVCTVGCTSGPIRMRAASVLGLLARKIVVILVCAGLSLPQHETCSPADCLDGKRMWHQERSGIKNQKQTGEHPPVAFGSQTQELRSSTSCNLGCHLSGTKELRGYPLIRRVGAISLCKFMTVAWKQQLETSRAFIPVCFLHFVVPFLQATQ